MAGRPLWRRQGLDRGRFPPTASGNVRQLRLASEGKRPGRRSGCRHLPLLSTRCWWDRARNRRLGSEGGGEARDDVAVAAGTGRPWAAVTADGWQNPAGASVQAGSSFFVRVRRRDRGGGLGVGAVVDRKRSRWALAC